MKLMNYIKSGFTAMLLSIAVFMSAQSNCEYRNGLRILSCLDSVNSLYAPVEQLFADHDTIVCVIDVDTFGCVYNVPKEENHPEIYTVLSSHKWSLEKLRFENCDCGIASESNIFIDLKPNTLRSHQFVEQNEWSYTVGLDSGLVDTLMTFPRVDNWPPKRKKAFPETTRLYVKVFRFEVKTYDDLKWLLSVAFEK